ncbi:MAG TPA: ABC transporter substrate-binding protein [Candidatus Binatia bacterium]|nr:ABC transporter substrate-binding protein [Candidatus Binatia bacterium]
MKTLCLSIVMTLLLAGVARTQDVPKPSGNLNLKVGHPSTISLYDVPTQITHERLNKQGWSVKSVEFTRTDLNSQAVTQGTVEMAISQLLDPLRAIQKGGKIIWLLENNGGEFVMIAKKEIKDCKGIDGKRFAVHGETATTSLATKNWLIRDCKVNPKILVIPGGENRIVALQNNQIDATLVQLGDWLNLDHQAPGKYHVIDTGGLYNISGAGLWANAEWLRKNESIATAYVAETLNTFRMIRTNPKVLEAAITKYVPDTPKDAIGPATRAYINVVRAWPQNGGDTTMLEDTIKFFTETGELKPGLDSKQFVNTTILQNAQKVVGRVSGAR